MNNYFFSQNLFADMGAIKKVFTIECSLINTGGGYLISSTSLVNEALTEYVANPDSTLVLMKCQLEESNTNFNFLGVASYTGTKVNGSFSNESLMTSCLFLAPIIVYLEKNYGSSISYSVDYKVIEVSSLK